MKKKAQLARPSNLPGKHRNRKTKIGPCASCRARGRLILGFCRQCYGRERYRAMHPRAQDGIRKHGRGRPRRGSPSWVADWLKHQAENYLHSNAGHFDRNGPRLWVLTEDQVMELCRIIYMAVSKHSSTWHKRPIDEHQKKAWWDRAEGDGHYLDRHVMPEIKSWTK